MVVICVLPLAGSVRTGRGAELDIKAFNQLSESERFDIALASLRSRDASLDRFAYQLNEDCGHIEISTGVRTAATKSFYELRRNGRMTWLHCRRLDVASGAVKAEFWSNWDGSLQRSLTLRKGEKTPNGVIRDTEADFIRLLYCNFILGFRVPDTGTTVPEWLDDLVSNKKCVVSVAGVMDGNAPMIHLTVPTGANYGHQFWLDPARDYMPVRQQYVLNYKNGSTRIVDEVTTAQQADGFWVPKKIVRRMERLHNTYYTLFTYDFADFKRGTAASQDMTVDFPPETVVVDGVQKVAYQVVKDGSRRPMPLYSPRMGKLLQPTTREAGTGADPGATSALRPDNEVPPPSSTIDDRSTQADRTAFRWGPTVLAVVAVLIVAGSFVVLHRMKVRRDH
jgi:hypothetical protein